MMSWPVKWWWGWMLCGLGAVTALYAAIMIATGLLLTAIALLGLPAR